MKEALKVIKICKESFDYAVNTLPVVGKYTRKSPFSPTVILGTALITTMLLGFFWPLIKLTVLGSVGAYYWFVNEKTKNNPTSKYAIAAVLATLFFII